MPSKRVKQAIAAFEQAVENRAFIGTIPLHCDDDEEQERADHERFAIEHNYVKARAKLERLMENV
jgi:hypothetical protein